MKRKLLHELNFTKLTYAVIRRKDLKIFKVAFLGLWVDLPFYFCIF